MSRNQARVYGEVAELYDRRRPGYPDALYDALVAAVPNARRALEAGAGTGKATVARAERGLEVEAIEPDALRSSDAPRGPAGPLRYPYHADLFLAHRAT